MKNVRTIYNTELTNSTNACFFMDKVPTIPTFWRTKLQSVNNRVSAFSHASKFGAEHTVYGLHEIYLTSEEPLIE